MIKNKGLFWVQLTVIIVSIALTLTLVVGMLTMNDQSTTHFSVASNQSEPASVTKNISVNEKYTNNLVLNKTAIIKRVGEEIVSTEIEAGYILEIHEGEVLDVNRRVAYNSEKEILCPALCRVLSITKSEEKCIVQLDLMSNYAIELFLYPTDVLIYGSIKETNMKEVGLTINGVTSFAYISDAYYHEESGGYKIILQDFTYNPYIFEGYIAHVYCFIQAQGSYLLFPKNSCFYSLSDDGTSIYAKKFIAECDEYVDVNLPINRLMTDDKYFYVYNYTENCGKYMPWTT